MIFSFYENMYTTSCILICKMALCWFFLLCILGYYWFFAIETAFAESPGADKEDEVCAVTPRSQQPVPERARATLPNRGETSPSHTRPPPHRNRVLTEIVCKEMKGHWNWKFKPPWGAHSSDPSRYVFLSRILSSEIAMKYYWEYIFTDVRKHFLESQRQYLHPILGTSVNWTMETDTRSVHCG